MNKNGKEPMQPSVAKVLRVQQETPDTYTIMLKTEKDEWSVSSFDPGQFAMVYVYGIGEVPISISGDPSNKDTLTFTVRAVGDVTRAFTSSKVGDIVGIRGPFGSRWPLEAIESRDVVVMVGGLGLAPLRAAIYRMLENRSSFGRLILLYGARNPGELLYKKDLTKWTSRRDFEVFVTVDKATPGWSGNVGVVTKLVSQARPDPRNSVALVCGPEIMMRYATQELEERGFSSTRIYLSMERNMKCGIGLCGHCQFGPHFICKDGPIFSYDRVKTLLRIPEV